MFGHPYLSVPAVVLGALGVGVAVPWLLARRIRILSAFALVFSLWLLDQAVMGGYFAWAATRAPAVRATHALSENARRLAPAAKTSELAQVMCRPGRPVPAPYVNELLECRTERALLPWQPPPPPPPAEPPLTRKMHLRLWQSLPRLQSFPLPVQGLMMPDKSGGEPDEAVDAGRDGDTTHEG